MGSALLGNFNLTHTWHAGNKFILVTFREATTQVKLTPPASSLSVIWQVRLPCCSTGKLCITLRSFSSCLILPLGTHKESMRAAIILNTCFSRFMCLHSEVIMCQWTGSLMHSDWGLPKTFCLPTFNRPSLKRTANRPRVAQGRTNEPHQRVQSA